LCNHPQAHIAKCGDIQILMLAITFNNKKTRYVTNGWGKKGNILVQKICFEKWRKFATRFFFYFTIA
jgi:hypothetical protein